MGKVNILALDTASYTTGYAIYKDGKITESGVIKLRGKGESDQAKTQNRIAQLYRKVSDLIVKHNITQIVGEDIFKSTDPRKKSAVEVLAQCRGAVISATVYNDIEPVIFINPLIVKHEIWGYDGSRKIHRDMPRAEQKARMIRAVERLGYTLNTDRNGNKSNDQADAIGILITYLKRYNMPIPHPVQNNDCRAQN